MTGHTTRMPRIFEILIFTMVAIIFVLLTRDDMGGEFQNAPPPLLPLYGSWYFQLNLSWKFPGGLSEGTVWGIVKF